MANPWYREGTISLVSGSRKVSSVDTLFLLAGVVAGDMLLAPDNKFYEIEAVQAEAGTDALLLKTPYAGASVSNQAYALIRLGQLRTTSAELAARIAQVLTTFQGHIDEQDAWINGTATGGPNGDGYYPITDGLGNTTLIPSPAKLQDLIDAAIERADTAASAHEAKGPLAHAVATTETSGFMSAADKAKVDALKSAANENVGTDPLDLPRNLQFGTAAFVDWEQLVTRGSNANGEWVRFPDGTQICYVVLAMGPGNVAGDGTLANMYRTAEHYWTFPQKFLSPPTVIATPKSIVSSGSQAFLVAAHRGVEDYRVRSVQVFRGTNSAEDVFCQLIAIGRWK